MRHIFRIIRFTRELWPFYVTVSILSVMVAILTQIVPLLTKAGIDRITKGLQTGHTDVRGVAIIVIFIFLCDFGQSLISNINGFYGDILSIRLRTLLNNRYYAKVMELPQNYFDKELTGKIINRLTRGVDQLTDYLQFFSNNFLQLIFSTLFSIGIVAYYSWPVALILLALFPTYAWLTARSSGKWQDYQKQINHEMDKAIGRFTESVSQVRVVKSFVKEVRELSVFDRLNRNAEDLTHPQSRYWHQQDFLRRSVLAVMFLAMYAIIFIGTAKGRYTIGTMIMLIQFAQLTRLPLFSLSFYVDRTQRAVSNSKDYFAVMDEKVESHDHPNARAIKVAKATIRFKNVYFGYDPNEPVLQGLSFELKHGRKLALVGESGQGKTTVTSLLLRFYEVDKGSITIDGQNVNDVTQESLRRNIGVVFQEPALFSGTIRENIAYANPDAADEDVEAAARAANAHDFISKFPKGYDTEIGERGLKLSGGQKQRIAIARAILKDAPILILDEATSSLDTRSERLVHEALERLMEGRSTLIIAHRLSTIQAVDTIVTMEGGKAREIGSPSDLAHTGGIYSQLLALQQSHTVQSKKRLQLYDMEEN